MDVRSFRHHPHIQVGPSIGGFMLCGTKTTRFELHRDKCFTGISLESIEDKTKGIWTSLNIFIDLGIWHQAPKLPVGIAHPVKAIRPHHAGPQNQGLVRNPRPVTGESTASQSGASPSDRSEGTPLGEGWGLLRRDVLS
jgi:hypothetical protein